MHSLERGDVKIYPRDMRWECRELVFGANFLKPGMPALLLLSKVEN
jgi:hypothetical protein